MSDLALRSEQAYSLTGLAHSSMPMGERALYCLVKVDALARATRGEDLAIPLWLAAAQTFALLDLSERIGDCGAGYNLVQAICATGGIQP